MNNMKKHSWVDEFPAVITVCDENGVIVEMNQKSIALYEKNGGKKLIGRNLLACHNPKSKQKIKRMLKNKKLNAYTIEKKGIKKLVYQSPWYKNGKYAGIVEFSLPIPFKMPHFKRD